MAHEETDQDSLFNGSDQENVLPSIETVPVDVSHYQQKDYVSRKITRHGNQNDQENTQNNNEDGRITDRSIESQDSLNENPKDDRNRTGAIKILSNSDQESHATKRLKVSLDSPPEELGGPRNRKQTGRHTQKKPKLSHKASAVKFGDPGERSQTDRHSSDRIPRNKYPEGSNSKQKKEPKLSNQKKKFKSLPATDFAPAYQSPLLFQLEKVVDIPHSFDKHFEHLNCSHLTHSRGTAPPTIVQLKQHAQAMYLLIMLIQPPKTHELNSWPHTTPEIPFPPCFDFLINIKEPYSATGRDLSDDHTTPLKSVTNELSTGQADMDNIKDRTKAELLADANRILTRLDHLYNSTGGILSIPLPSEPDEDANTAASPSSTLTQNSVLAQWLSYTRALTLRFATLEADLAGLCQVLSHEATIPGVRAKQSSQASRNGDGSAQHKLVFPQDRYVLAGLSEALWHRLHDELSDRQRTLDEDESNESDLLCGRGVRARGNTPFRTGPYTRERDVVSWIECTSRLYRISGHDTIFVIPRFGLDPEAPYVREVERLPLAQTVTRRHHLTGSGSGHGGGAAATAWERDLIQVARERADRIRVLEERVRDLEKGEEEDGRRRGRRRGRRVRG